LRAGGVRARLRSAGRRTSETSATLVETLNLYRSTGWVEVPAFNDEPFADRAPACRWRSPGAAERLDYCAEVEEHLYRIALEALNDSIEHAQAATVRVNITAAPSVEMLIADDATGFDAGQMARDIWDWGPFRSAPRASVRL